MGTQSIIAFSDVRFGLREGNIWRWIWIETSADVNLSSVCSDDLSFHRPTQNRLISLRRFRPSRSNPGRQHFLASWLFGYIPLPEQCRHVELDLRNDRRFLLCVSRQQRKPEIHQISRVRR